MASRRQKLTQRRKAVGFTQESLAEHLGVERSTVIRWEAGDSEPLPSIRPSLARALQVSIDQLADLLTGTEDADTIRTPSADPEEIVPVLPPEIQPPGRPDGSELDTPIHPQVAETLEALRRALRSADVSAEELAAMLVGSPPTESPTLSAPSAIPPDITPDEVQRRHLRSRRGKRFAAAGVFVLALPAVWLSPPFESTHGGAGVQTAVGALESAVPVLAGPAPNHGPGTDNSARPAGSPGDVDAPPVVVPAGGSAAPPAAAGPAPHTVSATGHTRTVRRSTRPAMRPPSRREWVAPAAVAADRWGGVSQIDRVGRLW